MCSFFWCTFSPTTCRLQRDLYCAARKYKVFRPGEEVVRLGNAVRRQKALGRAARKICFMRRLVGRSWCGLEIDLLHLSGILCHRERLENSHDYGKELCVF